MNITEKTQIKRIDLQGINETKIDDLQECYEYSINTQWLEDHLETQEYDEMMKETDNLKKLTEISIFGDIYEYEFIVLIDGKEINIDEAIKELKK